MDPMPTGTVGRLLRGEAKEEKGEGIRLWSGRLVMGEGMGDRNLSTDLQSNIKYNLLILLP